MTPRTRSLIRVLRPLPVVVAAISVALTAPLANAFTISSTPLFLPTPLAPNIVFTFDDSGSMRWAYAPDDMCTENATRRVKSSHYNPLYYNPNVRYDPPLKFDAATATYSEYTTSFTNAFINGLAPGLGAVDLSSNYRPTWSKNPATSTVSVGGSLCGGSATNDNFAPNPSADYTPAQINAGVPAYYYVFDPSGTGCSPVANNNDDCYRRVVVSATSGPGGTDERQNFANWYSFYRTRILMTSTAATRALANVPATARVGWQALNSCNGTTTSGTANGLLFNNVCQGWTAAGITSNSVDKRIKVLDPAHRGSLYHWLSRLPASGGTPLRTAAARVGNYFRSNGVDSPYAQNPTISVGTEFTCRPNFHVLMTDGIWNDGTGSFCSGAPCGNKDNTSVTLPDGKSYSNTSSLTRIYRDNNSDSVADIAFHYWASDLRPDLADDLIPYRADRSGTADQQYWNPKNNPATWQHLVTFTVGIGLGNTLSVPGAEWGGHTYAAPGYPNLLAGTATWPATASNASPGNVYDLWHAAINSRGQSFSADTPQSLSEALNKVVNRILERETAAAGLATNSTRLATDTRLFQARFNSGGWTGGLTAYAINPDGSVGPAQWDANDAGKIPAHNARRVFTWSGSSGIDFDQTSLAAAGLWSLIGSTAMLNYLRGDPSDEQRNGGGFRDRSVPLGDIVNSDPVFVGAQNFGYRVLPEGADTSSTPYAGFLAAKKTRRKMLYVGSNDGYLRAFDAATGVEQFAYVPGAVIAALPLLANPAYAHRFYVDGSPTTWDAHFGGSWRTVVTATTGVGGKSVFALDVTDPDAFAASKVLWEINDTTPYRLGDATDPQYGSQLGYTVGQAVVAKLNNGEWAAVFGNGYRSASDKATLYVVRIADGTLIRKIETGIGSAAAPNGLGTPTLYDANGDNVYDYAYVPDMQGNVWKFDLSATSPAAWNIAFAPATGFPNGAPLFQARNASGQKQPIAARVELAAPPPSKPGIIVVFGTGRFFAVGDNIDTTAQTFYGIWDNGSRIVETDRSSLQPQTISTRVAVVGGVPTTVRDVTSNTVDWTSKRGWYIDLPTSLERVIGGASVRGGRVIFTSLIPSSDPCKFGGSGWLMEVSATTGAKLPYSVFDTNRDGDVNSNDDSASGMPLTVGMVKQPLVVEGSPTAVKFLSGTSGNVQMERNRTFGPPLGRESWRDVRR